MSGDRRRASFTRAAVAGSALALVIDLLMLSAGHAGLWQPMGLLGSFYDAQGRALLHGHLSVPAASASFEGFVIGGRTYLYFGPFPALLRLPVLLVTHGLDGRMTQLSMLLALVVLLIAGADLHWRIRELIRPGAPVGRGERIAAFALAVTLGAGIPLFLAGWAVVYQEAELWGAALSLAAIDAVCGVIARPTGRRIFWAGLWTLLAVNTRVSVGIGPILALGLLAVGDRGGVAARRGGQRPAPGTMGRRGGPPGPGAARVPAAGGRLPDARRRAGPRVRGGAQRSQVSQRLRAAAGPAGQHADRRQSACLCPGQPRRAAGAEVRSHHAAGRGATGRAGAGPGVSLHRPPRLPPHGHRWRALQRAAALAERIHLDATAVPAAAGRIGRVGAPTGPRGL